MHHFPGKTWGMRPPRTKKGTPSPCPCSTTFRFCVSVWKYARLRNLANMLYTFHPSGIYNGKGAWIHEWYRVNVKKSNDHAVTGFGHTHWLLVLATRQRTRNFSLFYFIFLTQQRRCSDGGYILISPSPRSHLTDEVRWRRVANVANQRVARGLWAAFLYGGGGVVQRLLPHGMTWWNWGVVLPYYIRVWSTWKVIELW